MEVKEKQDYTMLIELLKTNWKRQVLAGLLMIANSALAIINPLLIIKLFDHAIIERNEKSFVMIILSLLLIALLQGGTKFLADYIYTIIGKQVMYDLRMKLVKHLMSLSGNFFSCTSSGELMTIINDDVDTMEEFTTKTLFSFLYDLVVTIVMFLFLIRINFELLMVSIMFQPLLFFVHRLFSKKFRDGVEQMRVKRGESINVLEDFFGNMLDFKQQKGEKLLYHKYNNQCRMLNHLQAKLQIHLSLSYVFTNVISCMITTSILGYGGYMVLKGRMSIGVLLAFNSYANQLLGPVFRIAQLKMSINEFNVSYHRIQDILQRKSEIDQKIDGIRPNSIEGRIEFSHVRFQYQRDRESMIFEDLSFVCSKGVTGIVGESGAGKSTIVNLIYRLWDPAGGKVLLDGKELREYDLQYVRENIGVVSQNILIFNDTIYNNIVMENTEISKEKVIEVCRLVDLYDFISSLEKGLDTYTGQNGVMLSGGQKQKISIARLLLRNAQIVIFDEATSAMDNLSENVIQKNILELLKEKTVLVIAHRLSTIENADNILVLQHGCIVEEGTHKELMEQKGVYCSMYMKNKNAA